jgi:ubiquinone/menaquinone biosynthesis C-methylase UbiE
LFCLAPETTTSASVRNTYMADAFVLLLVLGLVGPLAQIQIASTTVFAKSMGELMENPISMEIVPTQAGYDRWAEFYDAEDNPLVLLEEQHIGRLAGGVAGLAVADIGCGTGRHALRWAAAGARVTAVDFSEAMLQRARAKPGAEAVTFLRHDLAEPLPLAGAAFDRVFCCLVLDHIAELDKFFLELRRICRPTGRVIISVMHPAMSLRGVQARFIEAATGRRISPASHAHQMSDYLMAAVRAGLALEHVSEHLADAALAARSPRAGKYLGWPMLLLMKMVPGHVGESR